MSSDRSTPRTLQQNPVTSDSTLSGVGAAPSKRRQPAPNHATRTEITDAQAPRGFASVNGSESQPMTASTSSSSEVAGPDPASSSTTAPAPYGTRSRGRNGAPRPNYAEDRDIDIDLELTAPASKTSSSRRSAATSQNNNSNVSPAADSDKASGVHTRKGQATTNGTSSSSGKDAIPGTSTFSANPNAGGNSSSASRKRKQPPSGTTSSASTNAQASSKKILTTNPAEVRGQSDSNMMTFETHGAYLKNGKLKADDGTVLAVNDHVYLICEPPGEPYYLARIMEFLPSKDNPTGPIEYLRVNWYYRPRDIQRKVTDTRVVFASMHSDTCPLTSLRGKCQILHLSEIEDLDEYRKTRDCFWYEKMFDRYIHRYYEVIPTSKVINVPSNVKKVLDERWKFVLVEMGRRKELTSAVKTCKRCGLYAASSDSVDCAVCHNTYHMYCVRPVLTKKPARGFAWACAACSRAQERKLEARNTPIIGDAPPEVEEEPFDEEEDEPPGPANGTGVSTPVPVEEQSVPRPATAEQIAQAKLWPYRYLGIHCRVEDALDYDDRIYPRASSRLGPRHQANVPQWHGHPVEYVKSSEIKKKYAKGQGSRKDVKLSKEALAALETEKQEKAKRPKWVMDEPPGYIRRGEDEPVPVAGKEVRTSTLLWKMPDASQLPSRGEDDAPGAGLSEADREKFIDDYMNRAKEIAPEIGVEKYSTNFLDKALEFLYSESFNVEAALARLRQINKYSDLKEPHLRPEEVKLFEQGVAKYGSELRNVTKHVGTVPHYQIVRYYYMWKKTPRGRQIWGNYEGRRNKKETKRSDAVAKLVDDVADDQDDSAFDNDKAAEKKRGFECKFCSTRSSRQWRRAPGVAPGTTIPAEPSSKKDKGPQLTVALCLRCALLWRKYGIQWENVDEVAKKVAQGGTKAWRRRIDEELLAQLLVSTETPISINSATAATAASIGVNVNATPTLNTQVVQEPAKKKAKTADKDRDKDSGAASTSTSVEPAPKKKQAAEKAPEPPPLVPDPPKAKTLPCAICNKMEPMGDQHLSCRDCRLTVHRGCYGISPTRNCAKWFCDMCSNDRNPMISTCYECVLCPVTWTEHELMEPPKVSHKKKTDREREKERLEKEMVIEAIKLYRQRQEAVGKPIGPREPLKRTAGNNWVHVMCAVWNPEIKFGNAKELEPAEGFGLIPADRYREVCKICKTNKGACVPCQYTGCNAQFHVGCAFQAGYTFGFDVTPIKSSRKDAVNTIKLGEETGYATAAIWCSSHGVQSAHEMSEPTDQENVNALQLFAQTYKQADLTLTGTVRKAAHVQQSVITSAQNGTASGNRRVSSVNGIGVSHHKENSKGSQTSPEAAPAPEETTFDSEGHTVSRPAVGVETSKKCYRCSSTFSPRWWPVENVPRAPVVNNGTPLMNGVGLNEPVGSRYPSATSASPPFQTHTPSHSQSSLPRLNGEYNTPDRSTMHTSDGAHGQHGTTMYECHKCHMRKPTAQPSPEPRPSPYSAQRGLVLPPPRPAEYQSHPYGPHAHPPQPEVLPRPMGPGQPPGGPEWYPGYDPRRGEYGDPNFRNGIPPPGSQPNGIPGPGYHGGPPQQPMNGYLPPHPGPPPPHYANGVPPPPQSYPTHQSPYAAIAVPSPQLAQAPRPRSYGASTSPPDIHASMVRHSPQHSLSGGPPPPPRVYSVDRVLSAPTQSPSLSRGSVDPQVPSTPGKQDEPSNPAARPTSSGRHASANGTGSGSGASASPSLKNLLS